MRTANTQIKTLTQRQRLKSRTAPYFNTIAPRRLLGYIKSGGETLAGSWVVQVETGRTETGQPVRRRQKLGIADDFAQANGTDVLSYQQALAAAIQWGPDESPSGTRRLYCARRGRAAPRLRRQARRQDGAGEGSPPTTACAGTCCARPPTARRARAQRDWATCQSPTSRPRC